jgi:selenocysteine-specific elongation factor
MSLDEARSCIDACIGRGLAHEIKTDHLVSPTLVQRVRRAVFASLMLQAEATDDAWSAEQSVIQRMESISSPDAAQCAIDQLVQEKKLARVNQMIAVANEKTALSKKQRARMEQILAMFRDTRMPPTIKEIAQETGTAIDSVSSLIRYATGQRILIDLGSGFFVSSDVFRVLCQELHDRFQQSPQLSVAEIRDLWQVTRKHAIPLLEYCDQIAVSVRDGDARKAGPSLDRVICTPMSEEEAIEHD